jgi:hypothetical protein
VQLDLAGQLREENADAKIVAEARSRIEAVGKQFPNNIKITMRVKAELVRQCIAEKDYVAAENHCRELLNWESDHRSQVLTAGEKLVLQKCQISTATSLMNKRIYSSGSKAEKEKWLKQFISATPENKQLDANIQIAEKKVAEIDSAMPDVVPLETRLGIGRAMLLLVNAILILVIGCLVVRKRMFKRRFVPN